MRAEPRRVLMLAYVFPPLGGGGVYRTLKHVKYLPQYGYDSVVVTTRARWYPARDDSLLDEVPPGTQVLAAPELPVAAVRRLAMNPLHRLQIPWALSFLGWPDPSAGWIPGAVWSAWRAARRLRPAVIYSSHPPPSAHAVALVVSRLTGLPWVADFRDGWALNPQGERLPGLISRSSRALEQAVVRRSSQIVVADDSFGLLGIDVGDSRRHLIPNGVDPDDVPPMVESQSGSKFRVAHVGTLYGARNASAVLEAFDRLIRRGAVDRERLELRMVGLDFRAGEIGHSAAGLPLSWRGYVNHREALEEMSRADVLLLLQPPGQRGTSGKLYEYLATGRPILCIAPSDNLACRLVRDLAAGECASPDDVSEIEAAVERLYRRWREGKLGPSPEVRCVALERYSRAKLTGDLAHIFDAAVDGANP